MYNVIEGQQAERKFNSQTMAPSTALSCKADTDQERRSDKADTINMNSNVPDYFGPTWTEKQTKEQAT